MSYDPVENEVWFVKIGARDLGIWLEMSFGPKCPKSSYRPQIPRSWFFIISWFYWILIMILQKMRSSLWKLELGFLTYGLIFSLGPYWPRPVFRSHTPHVFIGHFWKSYECLFPENWKKPITNLSGAILDM